MSWGDHAFTGFLEGCGLVGLATWVVARQGALSGMLAAFAGHAVCLQCLEESTRHARAA